MPTGLAIQGGATAEDPNALATTPGPGTGSLLYDSRNVNPAEASSVPSQSSSALSSKQQSSPQYRPFFKKDFKEILKSPACVHLISGAIAGGVSRTVTAPLDRLKAVLQITQSTERIAATATLRRLLKEEGFLALFKGNGANCVKVVPECAIKFVAYDFFKRKLISFRHSSEVHVEQREFNREVETEYTVRLSLAEKLVAGGCAGAVGQLIVYPMEVIKTRLATSKPGLYRGIIDCIIKTYSHDGLAGFYRGMCPSLLGIIPYAGLDLACFETLKREYCLLYHPSGREPPINVILACGAVSSGLGQVVAYPLALVRTRLQVDGINGSPRQFRGMRDVFSQTFHQEGFRALYRGLVPNLLKAVPAVSITWAVYESCKHRLQAWI